MFGSRYINWKYFGVTFLLICLLFYFCEVLIYYVILLQCAWPHINTNAKDSIVKAMILADTHLLGPRYGHWFDKLRREWQMYRTFQTAIALHDPQVVFILGDIFDEGFHCSDAEFLNYVNRFRHLFSVPETMKLFVIIGNHDIGFHYRISPKLKYRFEKAFNVSSVEMLHINGNVFILINSMSLEGDRCFLCKPAEEKLQKLSNILKCAKFGRNDSHCIKLEKLHQYSQPILLQHFPLYRTSDAECIAELDAAPKEIINESFRETWECLSKESTEKLLNLLEPRAVFTGHTHHGCFTLHRNIVPEWTVPSFSWRNKNNPSFILAVFAPDAFVVSKCYMPKESTIINIYICGGIMLLVWIFLLRKRFFIIVNIKHD